MLQTLKHSFESGFMLCSPAWTLKIVQLLNQTHQGLPRKIIYFLYFLWPIRVQNTKQAKIPPQWACSLKETIIFYAESQIFFPEPIFLLTTLSIEKSGRAFLGKIELKEEFGVGKQEVGFYCCIWSRENGGSRPRRPRRVNNLQNQWLRLLMLI